MKRSNALPWVAAVLTSLAAWGVATRWPGALSVGRQASFVIFGILFAGAIAFVVARRLVHGPDLDHDEWLLMRDRATQPPALTVDALRARLAQYGYRLRFTPEAIWQQKVTLVAEGIGRGELRLELGNAVSPFYGTIEIADNPNATYDLFATCVIFELGELVPGLGHKRTYSTLPEEPTTSLQPLLPAKIARPGSASGA